MSDQSLILPTPGEWLLSLVAKQNLSTAHTARLLGADGKQVARWMRDEEKIPRPRLAEIAQQLAPRELEYALALKDCQDFSDHLWKQSRELGAALGLRDFPHEAVRGLLHNLIAQEPDLSCERLGRLQRRYLVDATAAVRAVHDAAASGFERALLEPDAVARFRFPMNHFLGLLLDMDSVVAAQSADASAVQAFRQGALQCLRETAFRLQQPHRPAQLAQWFTMHVLARHGTDEDRERIRQLLHDRRRPVGPLLRRICLTGLTLADSSGHEAAEELVHGLQHDRDLAEVNLRFHAFHYADAEMAADGRLSSAGDSFDQTIAHVLRHLEQRTRYGPLLDGECLTLSHVLDAAGAEPFNHPTVVRRLRNLLAGDAMSSMRRRHEPVRRFHDRFSALVRQLK